MRPVAIFRGRRERIRISSIYKEHTRDKTEAIKRRWFPIKGR